jgi:HlyD family secretion protein
MGKSGNLFRKKALEKLSSPEQLDQMMCYVRPKQWIFLFACLVLLLSLLLWGIFGSVPTKVSGMGILMGMGNVVEIGPKGGGRITHIGVSINDYVEKGETLAWIDQIDAEQKLEEAEKKLENLQRQLAQAEGTEASRKGYEDTYTEKQRQTLKASIVAAEERMKRLREMERKYARLFEKQLVTEKQYLDVRNDYDQVMEDILTYRQNLAKLPVSTVESQSQWEKERRDLEYQILQQQEQVRQLETTYQENRTLESSVSGYVTGIYKNPGEIVGNGEAVFLVEEVLSEEENPILYAQTYVSAGEGKKIRKNMEALVTLIMIKEEEYGSIRGRVWNFSDAPVSKKTMTRMLGDEDLVSQIAQKGAPMLVVVELLSSDSTVSGYAWTSGKGPPMRIERNTLCSVEIVTRRQKPITLVLPFVKKYLLGVGETE